MFKFRSMTVRKGMVLSLLVQTIHVYSRLGPFRLSKIDELPQLWNILIGDMSFVGPRPEDPLIVSHSADMLKTNVRPGLTGPGSILKFMLRFLSG